MSGPQTANASMTNLDTRTLSAHRRGMWRSVTVTGRLGHSEYGHISVISYSTNSVFHTEYSANYNVSSTKFSSELDLTFPDPRSDLMNTNTGNE